ncbi:MAG: glycosyltransferase [Candidatus Bathyarchaeota archaeon]
MAQVSRGDNIIDKESATQKIDNRQRISNSGRLKVDKKVWVFRVLALAGMISFASYTISQSFETSNNLLIYSTVMSTHTILVFGLSWFFFKTRPRGEIPADLASVIIPIYNQKSIITKVIASIYASSYQNVEVIAVNDGSSDGTKEALDSLINNYPSLTVIHKNNEGKRRAVATGFKASKGKYIILIDSDSIVDLYAIEELMRTFKSNPTIGGVTGYGKVLNAEENFLTKCQDPWYDGAFNIHKTLETIFGCVLCCSGCLSAYRREAIAQYIPYWSKSKTQFSDDRELTTYTIATPWAKNELTPVTQKLLESMTGYDDSEDRGLTAQTLVNWETVYVPTAVVYTEVPSKLKNFFRQQTRWKKGYLRTNIYVSAFFWRKNPLMAMIFYTELMSTLTMPLINFAMYIYTPFILGNYWLSTSYIIGQIFLGLVEGLDYKFRDKKAKHWTYKPLMNLFSSIVVSWVIFPALATYKKNQWLTR